MSYGPDVIDLFRSGATYVDRIIKADLPIQQPTKYELVINLKAASVLNISITQDFPARTS
jgi:putative ABC transport system substrate-binding protein